MLKRKKASKSNYYFDSFPVLAHYSVECGEMILEFMKNFDASKLEEGEVPLGRVIGEDIYISSPYEIGRNGSLICYKRINENDTISVMELLDYDSVGENTRALIQNENPNISFIFSYFNF